MIKDSKPTKVRINTKDNYLLGIFFIIISSLCFALISVMVKYVKHLPLIEILFFQALPSMIIIPIFIKKMHISFLGNNKPFLLVGGFLGIIIELAKIYTFTVMLLADATTIQKLSPLFVFFLSGIFLKEKLNLRQIPLLLMAFLGGILVIKPGLQIEIFPAMIALLAAMSIAVAHVNLRYLRLTDHYLVITNYIAYIGGFGSLAILLTQKSFQIPNSSDLFKLILIGLLAFVGWITVAKAYQKAEANLVAFYNYSQIIFASLLGLSFFKEIPDLLSIIGASFIIISGYFNYKMKTIDQLLSKNILKKALQQRS